MLVGDAVIGIGTAFNHHDPRFNVPFLRAPGRPPQGSHVITGVGCVDGAVVVLEVPVNQQLSNVRTALKSSAVHGSVAVALGNGGVGIEVFKKKGHGLGGTGEDGGHQWGLSGGGFNGVDIGLRSGVNGTQGVDVVGAGSGVSLRGVLLGGGQGEGEEEEQEDRHLLGFDV